jgi:hypothetical protein
MVELRAGFVCFAFFFGFFFCVALYDCAILHRMREVDLLCWCEAGMLFCIFGAAHMTRRIKDAKRKE